MQNRLIYKTFLPLSILFFFVAIANAETKSDFSFGNYTISLPADLHKEASPKGALLLATTQKSIYPTLNIIEIGGNYNFEMSLAAQKKAILYSYRQVGIQSAKLVSTRMTFIDGVPMFTANVDYESQNSLFTARIFFLPGEQSHFIGTFIHRTDMKHSETAFAQLIESLTIVSPPAATNSPTPVTNQPEQYLWALLLVFILLTTIWLLFGRKILKNS